MKIRLKIKITGIALLFTFIVPTFAFAQTVTVYQAPPEVINLIKDEAENRSQVMPTLSYLTDVIGARLTGSRAMKRANEWTRDTMTKWGLENAHLEKWGPFGRGWELLDFNAEIVSPYTVPLIAYPKAWSPSTKGAITADVIYFDAKTESDFAKFKGRLKDKIVLISDMRETKADFTGMGTRRRDEDLARLAAAPDPALRQPPTSEQIRQRYQSIVDGVKRTNFVMREGAAVMIDNSSAGSGGTLFVAEADAIEPIPADPADFFGKDFVEAQDRQAKMIPQMTLATEQYNRLVRLIEAGETPRMTVNIKAEYDDQDPMAYNTIAEIPGTDLKNEVVMLGAHLDSWHAGTGATDNGAGVAVVMEAARILQTLGLKPRRTVRVALWSGEEQGLYGSKAYVRQHFGELSGGGGNAPNRQLIKAADYEKLAAYYNLDNGTGKIRGIYQQGNWQVAPLFKAWLEPFKDLGAGTITIANTGGTDHNSFDQIGLPGFQFIQDQIEYFTRSHHSNQDVLERIQPDDLRQAALIMAAFVYQTAMMDEKLPRKVVK